MKSKLSNIVFWIVWIVGATDIGVWTIKHIIRYLTFLFNY